MLQKVQIPLRLGSVPKRWIKFLIKRWNHYSHLSGKVGDRAIIVSSKKEAHHVGIVIHY